MQSATLQACCHLGTSSSSGARRQSRLVVCLPRAYYHVVKRREIERVFPLSLLYVESEMNHANETNSSSTGANGGLIDSATQGTPALVITLCLIAFGLGGLAFCIYRRRIKMRHAYRPLKSPEKQVPKEHYHDEDKKRVVFALPMRNVRQAGGLAINWGYSGTPRPVELRLTWEQLRGIEGFADEQPSTLGAVEIKTLEPNASPPPQEAAAALQFLTSKQAVFHHPPCAWNDEGKCTAPGKVITQQHRNTPPFTPTRPEEWQFIGVQEDTPFHLSRQWKILGAGSPPPPPRPAAAPSPVVSSLPVSTPKAASAAV